MNKLSFILQGGSTFNLALIEQAVMEKKMMYEIVDDV